MHWWHLEIAVKGTDLLPHVRDNHVSFLYVVVQGTVFNVIVLFHLLTCFRPII